MISLKVNVGHSPLSLIPHNPHKFLLVLFLPWFTPVESFQSDHVLLEFVHEEGDSHSVDITRGWGERGIQVRLSIHPKYHRVRFRLQVPVQRPYTWHEKTNGNSLIISVKKKTAEVLATCLSICEKSLLSFNSFWLKVLHNWQHWHQKQMEVCKGGNKLLDMQIWKRSDWNNCTRPRLRWTIKWPWQSSMSTLQENGFIERIT